MQCCAPHCLNTLPSVECFSYIFCIAETVQPNWFSYGTEGGTVWSQYFVTEGNYTEYAAATYCTGRLGENATLAK